MPLEIVSRVQRSAFARLEYSKSFFVSLSQSDQDFVKQYCIQDGEIIHCNVLGIIDVFGKTKTQIIEDFDFEINGTYSIY